MPSPASASGTCAAENAGGNEGNLLLPSRGQILKRSLLQVYRDPTAPAVLWHPYRSEEHSHLKEHKVGSLNSTVHNQRTFNSVTHLHINLAAVSKRLIIRSFLLHRYVRFGRTYGLRAEVEGECAVCTQCVISTLNGLRRTSLQQLSPIASSSGKVQYR